MIPGRFISGHQTSVDKVSSDAVRAHPCSKGTDQLPAVNNLLELCSIGEILVVGFFNVFFVSYTCHYF
jgi:hypothetical protein